MRTEVAALADVFNANARTSRMCVQGRMWMSRWSMYVVHVDRVWWVEGAEGKKAGFQSLQRLPLNVLSICSTIIGVIQVIVPV